MEEPVTLRSALAEFLDDPGQAPGGTALGGLDPHLLGQALYHYGTSGPLDHAELVSAMFDGTDVLDEEGFARFDVDEAQGWLLLRDPPEGSESAGHLDADEDDALFDDDDSSSSAVSRSVYDDLDDDHDSGRTPGPFVGDQDVGDDVDDQVGVGSAPYAAVAEPDWGGAFASGLEPDSADDDADDDGDDGDADDDPASWFDDM